MRRFMVAGLATIAICSFAVTSTQPAQAACTGTAAAGEDITQAYKDSCTKAQARIDRYISSYPTVYKGDWDAYSEVIATSGTNSGNYARWKAGAVTTAWNRVR